MGVPGMLAHVDTLSEPIASEKPAPHAGASVGEAAP
jgi:hypothetical protein